LFLQTQASAIFAELSRREVNLKDAKPQKPGLAAGRWHRHDCAHVVYTAGNRLFSTREAIWIYTGRGYNIAVATPDPKAVPDDRHADHHRRHAYAAEATGLLVIGILLLILTLARYWSYINWSIR
jgi:hypothetical protein